MSDERVEEFSEPRLDIKVAVSDDKRSPDAPHTVATPDNAKRNDDAKRVEPKAALNEAKVRMRSRLPALDDDGEVGTEKEHLVTRDGKADLLFMGVLLASAAPASAPKGH